MNHLTRLRAAALAIIAVGTLHLGSAQAAEPPAVQDECYEDALEMLRGYCDQWAPGWDFAELYYTCEDGEITEAMAYCHTWLV